MFADPSKVALRRLKRRLKAGASIAIALAAGAFLALRGEGHAGPREASPAGPDARTGPDAVAAPRRPTDAGGVHDASADSALVLVRDGGADGSPDAARRPRVDRHEHRTGMPVRDNLLE